MNAPSKTKVEKIAINGIEVSTLLATIGAVNKQRDLAKFTFRANGEWLSGTHSRININGYFGAGGEQSRDHDMTMEADHPAVLCGSDKAPTPAEFLLAALSACITAGIGNIASARQIKLEAVETSVEGDINLAGILGLDDDVRNGYGGIRASFKIKGDASADKLRQVVEQSIRRSAVYDVLTNGVQIDVNVETM